MKLPCVQCVLKQAHGQLCGEHPVPPRSLIPDLCPVTTFNCCRIHRKRCFATPVPPVPLLFRGSPELSGPPSIIILSGRPTLFFFISNPTRSSQCGIITIITKQGKDTHVSGYGLPEIIYTPSVSVIRDLKVCFCKIFTWKLHSLHCH